MTSNLIDLLILALSSFFIIRLLVRWTVNTGVLSEFILKFVYPRRMAAAYTQAEKGIAAQNAPDEQEYDAKLAQLSAFRYSKRLLAVSYFENVPSTMRLVDRLIDILPRQHRQEAREAMIRLLCKTLDELGQGDNGQSVSSATLRNNIQIRIKPWSLAASAWLTEFILVVVVLVGQLQLSVTEFVVAGAAMFAMLFSPALMVARNRNSVVRIALVSLAVALASLWSYSTTAHSGFGSTGRIALERGMFGNTGIEIRYPRWLTADDMNACDKSVTIIVFGEKPNLITEVEVLLDYDHQIFYTVDKKCTTTNSGFSISATNPFGELAEISLRPLNLDVFTGLPATIAIQARKSSPGASFAPVSDLEFMINLEEPIWKTIRDICLLGTGAATAPAFLMLVYDRYIRKKERA